MQLLLKPNKEYKTYKNIVPIFLWKNEISIDYILRLNYNHLPVTSLQNEICLETMLRLIEFSFFLLNRLSHRSFITTSIQV